MHIIGKITVFNYRRKMYLMHGVFSFFGGGGEMRDFRRLICPALYAAVPAASLRAASKRFARFANYVPSELFSTFHCIDVCV